MLKKILIIVGVVLALFVVAEYLSRYNWLGEVYFTVLIIALLQGVVFGLVTKYISASKGYEGGFWWGFFLSVIGVLVVGFRPSAFDGDSPSANYIEEIEKLASLKERGIITEEEFNKKKRELLNKA